MTRSEFIICSICLGGKAFAQVALGDVGKQIVRDSAVLNSTSVEARYAKHVADTGALSVLFVSPIVVVLLSVVGPSMWLTDAEWANHEEKEKKEQEADEEMQQNQKQLEERETPPSSVAAAATAAVPVGGE